MMKIECRSGMEKTSTSRVDKHEHIFVSKYDVEKRQHNGAQTYYNAMAISFRFLGLLGWYLCFGSYDISITNNVT